MWNDTYSNDPNEQRVWCKRDARNYVMYEAWAALEEWSLTECIVDPVTWSRLKPHNILELEHLRLLTCLMFNNAEWWTLWCDWKLMVCGAPISVQSAPLQSSYVKVRFMRTAKNRQKFVNIDNWRAKIDKKSCLQKYSNQPLNLHEFYQINSLRVERLVSKFRYFTSPNSPKKRIITYSVKVIKKNAKDN